MKAIQFIIISVFLFACNNPGNSDSSKKDSIAYTSDNIAESRKTVSPNPIKTYTETIKSFETTDDFNVSLFETNQTFNYLIKINYKQLDAEDTLRIPNFGTLPSPQIIKGDKRPSCIIGFLDNDKKFRESKIVYFEDNTIKVHVLKYYGVTTK